MCYGRYPTHRISYPLGCGAPRRRRPFSPPAEMTHSDWRRELSSNGSRARGAMGFTHPAAGRAWAKISSANWVKRPLFPVCCVCGLGFGFGFGSSPFHHSNLPLAASKQHKGVHHRLPAGDALPIARRAPTGFGSYPCYPLQNPSSIGTSRLVATLADLRREESSSSCLALPQPTGDSLGCLRWQS